MPSIGRGLPVSGRWGDTPLPTQHRCRLGNSIVTPATILSALYITKRVGFIHYKSTVK